MAKHAGAKKVPPPLAGDSPELASFALTLRLEQGRAERTVSEYYADLQSFARHLGSYQAMLQANKDDIRRFVVDLMGERHYAATGVRRKLAALRAFYKYCMLEGLRSDNPAADVPAPKIERRLPKVLSEDEVAKVLRTSVAGRPDALRLRDRAMLELLYASGIRRAELVGLNLDDIDLQHRVARVIGKGNKERVVLLNDAASQAIEAYLAVRPRSADSALFFK